MGKECMYLVLYYIFGHPEQVESEYVSTSTFDSLLSMILRRLAVLAHLVRLFNLQHLTGYAMDVRFQGR